MPGTSMLDIVQANFSRRRDIQGELREIDEATVTNKDTHELRAYTDDEAAKIEGLRRELQTVDDRIVAVMEMEVRGQQIESGIESMLGAVIDRDHGQILDERSLGQRFTENGYTDWVKAGSRSKFVVDMPGTEFKNVVGDTTTGSGSAGTLTRPQRLDRIGRDFIDRKVYLLDLLPHIPVTQGAIEYVQDVTPLADMANKPTEVAESGTKPQAGLTFALKSESAAVIAAWVNITRQALADVPQIQAYLNTRLRYGIRRRADGQSINGTGVAPNLLGLTNRSGILTYAPGGAEARYKSIRHGIRLMEDAETVPEIIVMNPADAEIFDLSNDTSAGLHAVNAMAGDLQGDGSRTAWGLTQVRSTAIAAGTALLVDPMAVAVFDRQDVTAYVTDSHGSNFTSNILTLLLEARLGLGLFDPTGVLKLTYNGTV
jgi:HK97 family phage major capsid protein